MSEYKKYFDYESPETKEKFSGSYGLVITPDQATIERAEQLAESLVPHADFLTQKPHITLYHAKFSELPKVEVEKALANLQNIKGASIKLHDLQVFGGKFLFWNVIKQDEIQQAHEEALHISPFLDKEAQARALEENLELTPEQLESLKRYGHPLMKSLYLPHITLAYDPHGIHLNEHKKQEHTMVVANVNFAEIGQYGAVKEIIKLGSEN